MVEDACFSSSHKWRNSYLKNFLGTVWHEIAFLAGKNGCLSFPAFLGTSLENIKTFQAFHKLAKVGREFLFCCDMSVICSKKLKTLSFFRFRTFSYD